MPLVAPDPSTLAAALTTGVVPPALAARPVRVSRAGAAIAFEFEPDGALAERLASAGFSRGPALGAPRTVPCWAAAVPCERAPRPAPPLDEILLGVADVGDMRVAGRLLELGCARIRLMRADGLLWLRALDPPYYEVLRALEAGLAFARVGGRVWQQLGWRHPLAERLPVAPDQLRLVGADRWRHLADGPWTDVFDAVELVAPTPEPAPAQPLPARLRVPIRMVRGPSATAQLWRLAGPSALDRLEQLVREAPSDLISRLSFLATGAPEQPTVVLVGPANQALNLPIEAPAFAPYGTLPNLFLPQGTALAPPLGRSRLQAAVAPDPDRRYWLVPDGEGYSVFAAPLAAFAPLTDWVDYLASVAPELDVWVRSATFDFDDFIVSETPRRADPRPKPRRERAAVESAPVEAAAPPTPAPAPLPAAPAPRVRTALLTPDAAGVAFDEAARAFCADPSPLDAPGRAAAWAELADLAHAAGRETDAALCRARSLWLEPAPGRAAGWAGRSPGAALIGAPIDDVVGAQSLLAELAPTLDLRSHWLARVAVSAAAGGDRLALLRSRDTILAQLRDGLPIAREVPAFIRAQGGRATPVILAALRSLRQRYRETKRKRHMLEAAPELTDAYVDLVIAWGFARLGDTGVARSLLDDARASLPDDPLHAVCVAGFTARIEEALVGAPHGGPPPAELVVLRAALDTFPAYKADRLWNASFILAPAATEDAAARFLRARRGQADPLEAVYEAATPEDRAAAWDAALEPADRLVWARLADLSGTLPPALRAPRIERMCAGLGALDAAGQAHVLLELTRVADAADDAALMRRTVDLLREDLPGYAAEAPIEAAQLLRRFGRLPGDHEPMYAALRAALPGSPEGRIAAVHIAPDPAAALAALEAAVPGLADASPENYGRRVRALVQGLARTDVDTAVAGVERVLGQLANITDSLQTSSHFCLSVVRFMESMVLALVDEGLSLSDWARRWIAEDEHLLRRRIYQDTVGGGA